jgi:hypothetical protein
MFFPLFQDNVLSYETLSQRYDCFENGNTICVNTQSMFCIYGRWNATQLSKSQRLEELLSVDSLIPFSSFKTLHFTKYLSKVNNCSPSLSSSPNAPLYTPNAFHQKRSPLGKSFVLFNNISLFSQFHSHVYRCLNIFVFETQRRTLT